MTILTIIVIIALVLLLIMHSVNKESDKRIDRPKVYSYEMTIDTTQVEFFGGEVIDESFTFLANYKDSTDLARINESGGIDLYKRIPNLKSRFGVNGKGKQVREDSYIMNGKRYDITFIDDSDVKLSILSLEYNNVTYYK